MRYPLFYADSSYRHVPDSPNLLLDIETSINTLLETINSNVEHLQRCATIRAQQARDKQGSKSPTLPVESNSRIYGGPPFFAEERFFGRAEILENIDNELQPNDLKKPRCYTIHGLGGVGKSKIALAYASKYRSQYTSVLWIKSETKMSLSQSFSNIATEIGLPSAADHGGEASKDAVHKWLSKQGKFIILSS